MTTTYYAVYIQRSYWPDLSAVDENTHGYITDKYKHLIAVPTLDEAVELARNRIVSIIMDELNYNLSSKLVVNGLLKYDYEDADNGGLIFKLAFRRNEGSEDDITYTLSAVRVQIGHLYKQHIGKLK